VRMQMADALALSSAVVLTFANAEITNHSAQWVVLCSRWS